MITKIKLNNVASYKSLTVLETNKKINLIYGLNGTGKSTLSNYLHQYTDENYKSCSVEGLNNDNEILVYNQTFILETFFEAENLKGIFTLSKENKEAETKILVSGTTIFKNNNGNIKHNEGMSLEFTAPGGLNDLIENDYSGDRGFFPRKSQSISVWVKEYDWTDRDNKTIIYEWTSVGLYEQGISSLWSADGKWRYRIGRCEW